MSSYELYLTKINRCYSRNIFVKGKAQSELYHVLERGLLSYKDIQWKIMTIRFLFTVAILTYPFQLLFSRSLHEEQLFLASFRTGVKSLWSIKTLKTFFFLMTMIRNKQIWQYLWQHNSNFLTLVFWNISPFWSKENNLAVLCLLVIYPLKSENGISIVS